MTEAGVIVLTAFISPFRDDRGAARKLVPHGDFMEIYCKCPLEVCESRDTKGLYKRARAGEISFFTGIDSIYEEPIKPELTIETHIQSLEESINSVIMLLRDRGVIQ